MIECHDIYAGRVVVRVRAEHEERDTPWHKVNLTGRPMDALEAGEVVLAGFGVHEAPIAAKGKSAYLDIPNRKIILSAVEGLHKDGVQVNGKTVYDHGVVLAGYEVITHKDMLFACQGATAGATIESMGLLGRGGSDFWLLYPLESIDVWGDEVRTYLHIQNPLDGKTAVVAKTTTVRVVCRNTANLSLREKTAFEFRGVHTSGVRDKLKCWLAQVWAQHQHIAATVKETYGLLASRDCTTQTLKDGVCSLVYPLPAKPVTTDAQLLDEWRSSSARQQAHHTGVCALFESSPTATRATRGTLFGAYQALVEYEDFYRPRATRSSRFAGAGAARKDKALSLCLSLV